MLGRMSTGAGRARAPRRQRDRMYGAEPGAGPWFSGTEDFTGYMRVALEVLHEGGAKRILDIPAGHGRFTDALRAAGHEVTPADLNPARADYVIADMNEALPFETGSFDAAACLEGLEHLVNPLGLLGELIRVVRPGGLVVVSTPNVQNYYSRLQFLLTGTVHQFNPAELRDLRPEAREDRFHISPISYPWLRYFAAYHGAEVIAVRGDRYKKKWLLPLFAAIHVLGWPWRRALFFGGRARSWAERNRRMHEHLNSPALLLSRTMIAVIRKAG